MSNPPENNSYYLNRPTPQTNSYITINKSKVVNPEKLIKDF